jgi:CheY-specific phosphatase CheX
MQTDRQLIEAIVGGTIEIFTSQGIPIVHVDTETRRAGATGGQVIAMLSYRSEIAGDFCFKCSLAFARLVYEKIFGGSDEPAEDVLADTMAEVLNWISGTIKKRYQDGVKIIISTPMVFVREDAAETGNEDGDDVTVISFRSTDHCLTVELMVDETAARK